MLISKLFPFQPSINLILIVLVRFFILSNGFSFNFISCKIFSTSSYFTLFLKIIYYYNVVLANIYILYN